MTNTQQVQDKAQVTDKIVKKDSITVKIAVRKTMRTQDIAGGKQTVDAVEITMVNPFSPAKDIVPLQVKEWKSGRQTSRKSGKDLTFAHVINLRGDYHYANMPYNDDTSVEALDTLSVGNSYEAFLDNDIKQIDPYFEDLRDFYISDAGIYLPCQYNKELNVKYPSLPLFYALSRQLHRMNIHANIQNLGRLWDKLREQADGYIWVRKSVEFDEYFIVHTVTYDRYMSAVLQLLPSKDKQYNATNGEIVERKFKVPKVSLKFDTHYFRKLIFKDALPFAEGQDLDKINLEELVTNGYFNRFE